MTRLKRICMNQATHGISIVNPDMNQHPIVAKEMTRRKEERGKEEAQKENKERETQKKQVFVSLFFSFFFFFSFGSWGLKQRW